MKYLLFLLLSLPALAALAQNDPAADKKQIEALVNDFFVALQKRDTALMRSLAQPEADVWTVRRVNDSLITRSRTVADDMRRLATNPQLIDEKPFRIDVTLHRDIAIAWVPYTISVDGKFSHCGIDVFTLLRMPQGWKIVSLAYSIEPDACEELQGK